MSAPILVPAAIAKIIKKINNSIPAPIMKFFVFFMVFTTFPFCFGGSLPLPRRAKSWQAFTRFFRMNRNCTAEKSSLFLLYISDIHNISYLFLPVNPFSEKNPKNFSKRGLTFFKKAETFRAALIKKY